MPVRVQTTYICDKCGKSVVVNSEASYPPPPMPEGWGQIAVIGLAPGTAPGGGPPAMLYYDPDCLNQVKTVMQAS